MTKAPLQLERVKNELLTMKMMFPHSQMTGATIEITAPVWLQDCVGEGMDEQDFIKACSLARRNSSMFPTVGMVTGCHRELKVKSPRRSAAVLPSTEMTDQQCKNSLKSCRKIIEMLENRRRSPEMGRRY